MVHDKMIICEKEREERWGEQVRTRVFVTLTKIGIWDKSVCTFVVKVRRFRKGNWFFGSLIISADTMILTTTSSFL